MSGWLVCSQLHQSTPPVGPEEMFLWGCDHRLGNEIQEGGKWGPQKAENEGKKPPAAPKRDKKLWSSYGAVSPTRDSVRTHPPQGKQSGSEHSLSV